ncbi:hypothetical protein D3C77_443530 [compost metagenome]
MHNSSTKTHNDNAVQRTLRDNSRFGSHSETNGNEFVLSEGELVLLPSEFHSGYGYLGLFRCARDLDLSKIADEFEASSEYRHGSNGLILHTLESD